MRYYEIDEDTSDAKALSAKRTRLNKKIADAQRKKSEAGQNYQSKMRDANYSITSASADLQSS